MLRGHNAWRWCRPLFRPNLAGFNDANMHPQAQSKAAVIRKIPWELCPCLKAGGGGRLNRQVAGWGIQYTSNEGPVWPIQWRAARPHLSYIMGDHFSGKHLGWYCFRLFLSMAERTTTVKTAFQRICLERRPIWPDCPTTSARMQRLVRRGWDSAM